MSKTIFLYHYSNKDISKKLKINFFGYNSFSNQSKNFSSIKRLYFYIDKNKKEYFFNGVKYCYTIKIKLNTLYNLIEDKKRYRKKFITNNDLFNFLKKQGFNGIIANNGYNIAVIFKDYKIYKKEVL